MGGWIGADTVGCVCKLVLSPPTSEPASASRSASSPRAAVPEVSTQLQTLRTCVAGLDALWLATVCGWVGGCIVGREGLWVGALWVGWVGVCLVCREGLWVGGWVGGLWVGWVGCG